MKKWMVVCLFVCILFSALPASGAQMEGVYDTVCPINTAMTLVQREESTLVELTMFNATGHTVSRVEYYLYLFDGEGAPATDGTTNYFYAYAENLGLAPLSSATLYWTVDRYRNAMEIRNFSVKKVIFSGGEEWTAPQTLYAQPFFYTANGKTADGRYLQNETDSLTLTDYSYSSQSRIWSYWDDGSGWVPFSTDITAQTPAGKAELTVKLEINEDPNLYNIQYFMMAPTPGAISIHPYATGETRTVFPAKVLPLSVAAPDFAPVFFVQSGLPVGEVPLAVGLWDHGLFQGCAWAIWDGTAWVDFSYDRGPLCEIWRTGTIYLRLSYGESAAIYAFSVEGV